MCALTGLVSYVRFFFFAQQVKFYTTACDALLKASATDWKLVLLVFEISKISSSIKHVAVFPSSPAG